MSDVDTRPAASRGRTSTRGSRGSTRGSHKASAQRATTDDAPTLSEESGELSQAKKKYASELSILTEMFPNWSETEILSALKENNGDLPETIEQMANGRIFKVVTSKDRSRSKADSQNAAPAATTDATRAPRGRTASESIRGGRGRGDGGRGRGGARGGRAGAQNLSTNHRSESHTSDQVSVPTTDAWGTTSDAKVVAPETAASTVQDKPISTTEGIKEGLSDITSGHVVQGAKKTWASMFASKPKPETEVAANSTTQSNAGGSAPSDPVQIDHDHNQTMHAQSDDAADTNNRARHDDIESQDQTTNGLEAALTPPKDPLTEDNLEHVLDISQPPATFTAASTVGSAAATPQTQAPIGRPPMGGYSSSALRATGMPGRSASYQRRVLDQQEAVVMPGHNAVDRASVQFGSMGLGSASDSIDVDEEREDPATRTQPIQSPPQVPRASLPPAARSHATEAHSRYGQESLPTPKQSQGLPQPTSQHLPSAASALQQDASHTPQAYSNYSRYEQHDSTTQPQQKPYDPFNDHAGSTDAQTQQTHSTQQSNQQGQQQHAQHAYGSQGSAPGYNQYYSSEQQRSAYQNYYGMYGQQNGQSQQDQGLQQKQSNTLPGGQSDATHASQLPQQSQQSQSRYGGSDTPGSNPASLAQASGSPQQSSQSQSQSQAQAQQMHHQHLMQQGYPYGHPYYQSPYAMAYHNQFGAYPQGGPYSNKSGGMYNQPQGYGQSYDQSSTSGAGSSNQLGSMQSRDNNSSGLGELGRTPSTQSSQPTNYGSSDPYSRSQSGYPGQSQGYPQQSYSQQPADDHKYAENKANGPSPAMNQQPGRPSSTVNNSSGQQSQSQPLQSLGGYPGFNQSQYGFAGFGSQQQPQQGQQGYGASYGGGFGNAYGQGGSYSQQSQHYNGRGGWNGSYGH